MIDITYYLYCVSSYYCKNGVCNILVLWCAYGESFFSMTPGVLRVLYVCTHQTCHISILVHIGIHLLCGAFFSKGLWGLVAMLASSASQLVLGEQLNSWWDTPAPTWNNPGDLWSSSTSCRSGMSSGDRSTVTIIVNMWTCSVFLKYRVWLLVDLGSLP